MIDNKNKGQRKNKALDQEIALHFPFLNARQKRVVLALVEVFALKQTQVWQQLYHEQRQASGNNNAGSSATTVFSTQVPGVDMTQVIASPPYLVKENSADHGGHIGPGHAKARG